MMEEWETTASAESPPVASGKQEAFRRLLTELVFCLVGAPVLGFAAAFVRPPVPRPGVSSVAVTPGTAWEPWLYRWFPLVLLGVAFGCVVWVVIVLFRMGDLVRKDG